MFNNANTFSLAPNWRFKRPYFETHLHAKYLSTLDLIKHREQARVLVEKRVMGGEGGQWFMNTTGCQLTQKPAVIWYPISRHLHEKEEEQNAGPNDSDIYMFNSSTPYTHGHCANNAPHPTDPKTPICQSNVYYARNFCRISTPVNCQEPNWEYGNLIPKSKQQFFFYSPIQVQMEAQRAVHSV